MIVVRLLAVGSIQDAPNTSILLYYYPNQADVMGTLRVAGPGSGGGGDRAKLRRWRPWRRESSQTTVCRHVVCGRQLSWACETSGDARVRVRERRVGPREVVVEEVQGDGGHVVLELL